MESLPHYFQDLKDLLLRTWCQISQLTFRCLVEPMPQWVRAVLAAKGGVMADRCVYGMGLYILYLYSKENPCPGLKFNPLCLSWIVWVYLWM